MSYKYPEIKQYIIEKIENHEFQEGQMLPPERELTRLFNVSRMTVRRALDELIHDGLLVRKKSSGVIVTHSKESRSIEKVSFKKDQELIHKYGSIKTKVIEVKKIKNSSIADKVFKSDTGSVYQLKRVQYGENKPVVYENIYFKEQYFKNMDVVDYSQSMEDVLKETATVSINNEEVLIDAILADQEIASMLLIPVESPVLQITNLQKHDDVVVYFGINFMDGYEFNYKIQNTF